MSSPTPDASRERDRRFGGIGRVLLWKGGSVWVGRVGRAERHSHYAIQITLALDGEFLIRAADADAWQKTRSAIVQSEVQHEFDGLGSTLCILFVEPEGLHGRALRVRFPGPITTNLPADDAREAIAALSEAFARRGADDELLHSARAVLERLAEVPGPIAPPDSRIAASMQWIRDHLGSDITLDDAAASVHLSPSRFRHLFVAQTGISFRAYLRWARIESAVRAAFSGKSWTQAAQEAGFADSAHLSRTCRSMFGMSPNRLEPE